jgi:2,4-diaminopentanoate dehydrogenase-like protein
VTLSTRSGRPCRGRQGGLDAGEIADAGPLGVSTRPRPTNPSTRLPGPWATPEEGWVRNHGVVATANHCVNSIPYVVRAEPGIKTCLDLPVIAGRAHPRFARRT